MKWNKHAKLTATATSALLFALLLASCANNNNNDNVLLPSNNQIQQEQEENNENSDENEEADATNTEVGDDLAADGESSTNVDVEAVYYEATGKYVGAIDSNSIEVTIDGQATVFQLSEQFDYVINEFEENDKVSITYTKQTIDDGNYVRNIVNEIVLAK